MLLRFCLHEKQWARLLRGLTVARISPQRGQTKRKYPSLILQGGPLAAEGGDGDRHGQVVANATQQVR